MVVLQLRRRSQTTSKTRNNNNNTTYLSAMLQHNSTKANNNNNKGTRQDVDSVVSTDLDSSSIQSSALLSLGDAAAAAVTAASSSSSTVSQNKNNRSHKINNRSSKSNRDISKTKNTQNHSGSGTTSPTSVTSCLDWSNVNSQQQPTEQGGGQPPEQEELQPSLSEDSSEQQDELSPLQQQQVKPPLPSPARRQLQQPSQPRQASQKASRKKEQKAPQKKAPSVQPPLRTHDKRTRHKDYIDMKQIWAHPLGLEAGKAKNQRREVQRQYLQRQQRSSIQRYQLVQKQERRSQAIQHVLSESMSNLQYTRHPHDKEEEEEISQRAAIERRQLALQQEQRAQRINQVLLEASLTHLQYLPHNSEERKMELEEYQESFNTNHHHNNIKESWNDDTLVNAHGSWIGTLQQPYKKKNNRRIPNYPPRARSDLAKAPLLQSTAEEEEELPPNTHTTDNPTPNYSHYLAHSISPPTPPSQTETHNHPDEEKKEDPETLAPFGATTATSSEDTKKELMNHQVNNGDDGEVSSPQRQEELYGGQHASVSTDEYGFPLYAKEKRQQWEKEGKEQQQQQAQATSQQEPEKDDDDEQSEEDETMVSEEDLQTKDSHQTPTSSEQDKRHEALDEARPLVSPAAHRRKSLSRRQKKSKPKNGKLSSFFTMTQPQKPVTTGCLDDTTTITTTTTFNGNGTFLTKTASAPTTPAKEGVTIPVSDAPSVVEEDDTGTVATAATMNTESRTTMNKVRSALSGAVNFYVHHHHHHNTTSSHTAEVVPLMPSQVEASRHEVDVDQLMQKYKQFDGDDDEESDSDIYSSDSGSVSDDSSLSSTDSEY